MNLFTDQKYADLATRHHNKYVTARPFPHIVFDDFLPPDVASSLHDEFPVANTKEWRKFDDSTGKKLAANENSAFGEVTTEVIRQLNSPDFLQVLEKLTGIVGLFGDPYLHGGGLHQIERGGFLKIHADFNTHPVLSVDRRLNVLIYMNKGWQDEYGGHLELWDRTMKRAEHRILPIFNRCVIFSTTDWAYHGHPEPLMCPEGRSRKSLALYYYTAGRPEEEKAVEHATLYKHRPEDSAAVRTIAYRVRSAVAAILDKAVGGLMLPAKVVRAIEERVRPPLY
jgi:Rps23 Pro-64 3,4-dihydroxylase Tpa1-like proline 4-hydroxylase